MKRILTLLVANVLTALSFAQVTINLNTEERGTQIGSLHYGIFYEEINHAGDGGLYAELVRNRSFEDSQTNADSWSAVGTAAISLQKTNLLNEAQQQCLRLNSKKKGDGVRNNGFWGMCFQEGETYKFSVWMRSAISSLAGVLTVNLEDANGNVLTAYPINISLTQEWQQVTAEIPCTGSAPNGKMSMTLSRSGTVYVDVVSLFPPTYKDRPNGCRRDLAQMLADLHPRFMRFPGGCYIEGMNTETGHNRFEWKKTIGGIEERPGHWNVNWGYRSSDGLGFHELLQLSEDLGAKPLFVVNIGIGHDWMVDVNSDELNDYIQEALDAIEYCNGDTTTTYGALRAKNGHPEPFNLELIEIGNENEWMDNYEARYQKFYKALHAKHPNLTFIADREVNSTLNAVDEHYYSSPTWFESQYDRYDRYDRTKKHKIYVGEYAVTQDYGSTGNLRAALGEAIFMQGMENNSDVVMMNSYAPIFTHENDFRWKPDMIRFSSNQSYGTPSYYVQKLMANNVGRQNISWTEMGNTRGEVRNYAGLSTWQTSATFRNFKITRPDGTSYQSPLDGTEEWQDNGGTWKQSNGVLSQTNTSMTGSIYLNNNVVLGDSYTLEVEATKKSGQEGFLIVLNYLDADNYVWWNLGGWGNTKHAVEVCSGGSKSTVASKSGSLTSGKTYKIKVEVNSGKAKFYLDNKLMHEYTLPAIAQRKVYVSSQIDDEQGKLYVKMVNPTGTTEPVTLNLLDKSAVSGHLVQMNSLSDNDQNNSLQPYNVTPIEQEVLAMGRQVQLSVPAYSFNILVLNVVGADVTEEAAEGTYYIYNKEGDAFLSRGADWGTRATLDLYGLPIEVKKVGDGTYTLRYLDRGSSYLGVDGGGPYTDKNNSYPIQWQLQSTEMGNYRLYNTGTQQWITVGAVDERCSLTDDETQASTFCLIDKAMYARLYKADAPEPEGVAGWQQMDMSDLLSNPTMEGGTEGWETSFSKGITTRAGLNEVYEGYGTLSQTIEGLAPGWYRFTMNAFYRDGGNARCVDNDKLGYCMSNVYLFANQTRQRLATWASERVSDTNPNSMEEAAVCMQEGKYVNSVYAQVGEDGRLNVGLCLPQNMPSGWLIWGGATLTRCLEPQDLTSYIVNPSFEEELSNGWENNGMQRQGNNEANAAKTGDQYVEKFTWIGGSLGTASVKQTIKGLPDGDYVVSATCHAELQGDAREVKGVWLFAGDQQVAVTKSRVYEVPVSVSGGKLTIGFKCSGTDANWITVDNFRLVWMGDASIAYQPMLERAITRLQEILKSKTILGDEIRSESQQIIDEAQQAKTAEEMKKAIEVLTQQYEDCVAYRMDIPRNDPYVRYLFAYFPDNSNENLYYAVSEDGFKYTALNEGHRVMASDTVALKKGIRDPHILRSPDGKTFYMVATDMRSAEGWASNRGIVMYRSNDLIHWQHSTVHFPTRFPEWANVTRVWAPATVWDPEYLNEDGTKGRYMVYYSLLTNDGKCKYDKVFYSYANDDFTDLMTDPVYFYDRGSATIDADIVYDECDELYHMIYKNEGSGGICSATAQHLTAEEGQPAGSQWSKPSSTLQQTNVAVEGGGLFRLINTNTWVLMYDCYTSGYYQFCTTDDWQKYTLKAQTATSGAFTPRHGSVIPLTPQEYNALLDAFPTKGLKKVDIPVGIDSVTETQQAPAYDLLGRKIQAPGKGLYIQNGKVMGKK